MMQVPLSVWGAMMVKHDRARAKEMMGRLGAMRIIQRAIRKFRERRWRRQFNRIDPQLAQAVEEEKARAVAKATLMDSSLAQRCTSTHIMHLRLHCGAKTLTRT